MDNENENQSNRHWYKDKLFIIRLLSFICAGLLLSAIFISLMSVMKMQINESINDADKSATILNTYTSIILGFVAMTVSLIGMVLSFYNTGQTERNNLETAQSLKELQLTINNLSQRERDMDDMIDKIHEKTNELVNKIASLDNIKNDLSYISKRIEGVMEQKFDSPPGSIGGVDVSPKKNGTDNFNSDEKCP